MISMQHGRHSIGGLPTPDADSLAHCDKVRASIRRAIDASDGSISFAEFMQLALYAPGLGYYVAGPTKLGAAGDYVTAPELSPLFGGVVARQCAAVLEQRPGAGILELGAGSGRLCVDILRRLSELNCLPAQYLIVEPSPDLAARQRALIASESPELSARTEWLSGLPDRFEGVVIANEVADALPVERFERGDGSVIQLRVSADGGGFRWAKAAAPRMLSLAVAGIEADIGETLAPGYQSEISLGLAGWIEQLSNCLDEGLILLFDYGVSRREYYSRERHRGWLRCHFRHHAHDAPLIYPGIQDLSSWVDFTAVADAALRCGLQVAGYVTQAQFLINGGLAEEFAGLADGTSVARLDLSRQAKLLTLPGEMGEHFKCIGLSRGDTAGVTAFRRFDRAGSL